MKVKLFITLLLSIFAINTIWSQEETNSTGLKKAKQERFYITSISDQENLNKFVKSAKDNFDVVIKFKKIKYSKLEKIRNIKISVANETFKQDAEFTNTFEIYPIEITLMKDEKDKVTCKIIELQVK